MQHEVKPHNPYCKLIGQDYETKDGYVELVYGENNDGTNQGLEAYFYKNPRVTIGHHYSRRWPLDKVPTKYQDALLQLRLWTVHCPAGHKITLH
jgi:hypothetical protein